MLKKKSGFTLIELMVVIVIIGVLASLAIPRFTEASDKAKIAEAPRIIASYESAYLASAAENAVIANQTSDVIFDMTGVNNDSKWFTYAYLGNTGMTAQPVTNIGKFGQNMLTAIYLTTDGSNKSAGEFWRTAQTPTLASKYIPNYIK